MVNRDSSTHKLTGVRWAARILDNAERFLEESDLKDVMHELGVMGDPEIHFLEEIEAKTPETVAA